MPLNYPFVPHLLPFSPLPIFLPTAATGGSERWWHGAACESHERQRHRQWPAGGGRRRTGGARAMRHLPRWGTGGSGPLASLRRRTGGNGRAVAAAAAAG